MQTPESQNPNQKPERAPTTSFKPETKAELAQIIQGLSVGTFSMDFSHLLADWYSEYLDAAHLYAAMLLHNNIPPAELGYFQLSPEDIPLIKARSIASAAAKSVGRRALVLTESTGKQFVFSVEVVT